MNHIIYKGTMLGIYYNNKDSISGGKKRDTITEKLCSYQCEMHNSIQLHISQETMKTNNVMNENDIPCTDSM